jgi:hypothetical protein
MSPRPYYYEVPAPGVWIRHPLILEFEEDAQAELHAFARKALKEAVPVQVKVAVGKPAEEILRVACEEKVHLIVMGTHGRTGVRHLLLGSVAEAIARYAPVPGMHGAHHRRGGTLKYRHKPNACVENQPLVTHALSCPELHGAVLVRIWPLWQWPAKAASPWRDLNRRTP